MNKKLLKLIFFSFFSYFTLLSNTYSELTDKNINTNISNENSVFDKTHRFISNGIIDTVVWFDDFFSDKRILDEHLAHSSIRVQNDFRSEEGGYLTYRISFNMNIELKKLPEKLRLIIGGENREVSIDLLPKSSIKPGFEKVGADRFLFSGLRYNFIHTLKTDLFTEIGMELNFPLNPYFRNRYNQRFTISDKYYFQLAETVIWKVLDGWKETTEMNLFYLITKQIILQLNNALIFTNPFESLDWGSSIDFRYKISNKTAISYNMGLSGITQPGSVIKTYQVRCKLRKRFYRDWLYYEIEPENVWSRNNNGIYESKSAITFRLEIHFDN